MAKIEFYNKRHGKNRYVLHMKGVDYILSEETTMFMKQDIERALKVGEIADEGD